MQIYLKLKFHFLKIIKIKETNNFKINFFIIENILLFEKFAFTIIIEL